MILEFQTGKQAFREELLEQQDAGGGAWISGRPGLGAPQQAEPLWVKAGEAEPKLNHPLLIAHRRSGFLFLFLEGKHLTTNNTILNFRAFPFSKHFTHSDLFRPHHQALTKQGRGFQCQPNSSMLWKAFRRTGEDTGTLAVLAPLHARARGCLTSTERSGLCPPTGTVLLKVARRPHSLCRGPSSSLQ